MAFRRIPVEFEIDCDSGEVRLGGQRVFFMPVVEETYNALQAGLQEALTTYLGDEIDTFAEDAD